MEYPHTLQQIYFCTIVLFLYMLYCLQIADFGMSHDMETDYYYKAKGGKIPLCWTAPEAVFHRKYTTKSDVWSYGMVMYEIWSLGHKPFEEFYIDQVSTRTFSQVMWLSCDSTPSSIAGHKSIGNRLLPSSPSWLPQKHLQVDGGLLVSAPVASFTATAHVLGWRYSGLSILCGRSS